VIEREQRRFRFVIALTRAAHQGTTRLKFFHVFKRDPHRFSFQGTSSGASRPAHAPVIEVTHDENSNRCCVSPCLSLSGITPSLEGSLSDRCTGRRAGF